MDDIVGPTITTKTITGLTAATYYVVATAYKINAGSVLESAYTNEVNVQLLPCLKAVLNATTGALQYVPTDAEENADAAENQPAPSAVLPEGAKPQ